MDWSKINPHKSKIIAASAVTTIAVGAGALFYGVKPIPTRNAPASSPSSQAQTTPEVVDLKIKGNNQSRIYHLPKCPNYNDIAERNIVWFKTKEEAEKATFRIAKNC